jgi:hypothetical protein
MIIFQSDFVNAKTIWFQSYKLFHANFEWIVQDKCDYWYIEFWFHDWFDFEFIDKYGADFQTVHGMP